MDEEGKKVHNPKYKKFCYSINKFEKYPEMSAEGVGRAFGYLAWLMFIFSIFVVIGILIKFNSIAKQGIDYVDKNFEEINYNNGELSINNGENITAASSYGNLIINTNIEDIKELEEQNSSNNLQIIWLKQQVIAKYGETERTFYYKDILEGFGVSEFNKTQLVDFLSNEIRSPRLYICYGLAMIIYVFIGYFISTLLVAFFLSIFGYITALFAQLQMRFRAVFNMSIYAITLSTVLQLIYVYISMFTDFSMKYFDLMYNTVAFVCLAAAIFMLKSDLIKKQLEIMKIIEIKKQQEEQQKPEEKKEEEEKKEDEKEDKENKEDKKDEEPGLNNEVGGEACKEHN